MTLDREEEIGIPAGPTHVAARLVIPPSADGLVIFAHGSGSSRFSPRNRFVADHLVGHGLATLLADLLTLEEEEEERFTGHFRFDVALLGKRVVDIVDWAEEYPDTSDLGIGLFGASTGAAAALHATSRRPQRVAAVVSRGGRPDLASEVLPVIRAPTLFIVGGEDPTVLELNRKALSVLGSSHRQLEVIEGASHLFQERGALEQVAEFAAHWFGSFLSPVLRELPTPPDR